MTAEETELLKEFSPEQVAKLNEIISKHKGKPGGLIPVLEEAQVALEFLPISVQKKIAEGFKSAVEPCLRSCYLLFFFYHDPARQTYRARLSGNGLLCPRRQSYCRNTGKRIRH